MSQDNRQTARDWKSVSALVAAETDREKVLELARELISALDENSRLALGQVAPESQRAA